MREQEQRDAETKQGTWESKSSVMLRAWDKAWHMREQEQRDAESLRQARHMREQEQRDAETKQGTWESKSVCCCDKASDKKTVMLR